MTQTQLPAAVLPPAGSSSRADKQFQELWFALARRPWRSMVLLPAEARESSAEIAVALAETGTRLHSSHVTFLVVADALEPASATRFAEAARGRPDGPASPPHQHGRLIVSLRPVTVEPLGIAIARAADAVVLCIGMRRTRLASARRTIELIGRDKVTASIVVDSPVP